MRETLRGVSVRKYIEDTLKGYVRHLKTNRGKVRTDPSRMKRELSRGRRLARQREVCQLGPSFKEAN